MNKQDFDKWLEIRASMKAIRSLVAPLQKELIKTVLGDTKTGTEHAELYMHEITVRVPLSYSVDSDVQFDHELTNEEKMCVAWKPVLLAENWNALPKEKRQTLSKYVKVKPGSASIEVAEVQQ